MICFVLIGRLSGCYYADSILLSLCPRCCNYVTLRLRGGTKVEESVAFGRDEAEAVDEGGVCLAFGGGYVHVASDVALAVVGYYVITVFISVGVDQYAPMDVKSRDAVYRLGSFKAEVA